ncbi:DUF58 domain-containing protein [Paenibacillus tarimensis]
MNTAKTTAVQRWQLVAGVYASCALFMLFQGGKTSFMLFMILNVLLAYLVLGRWSGISRITGERRLIHGGSKELTLAAGTRLEVELNMRIPGVWPIPYVLVRERLLRKGGKDMPFEVSFVPDIKRNGFVSYLTPPLQRGYYQFAPTVCSTRDIFGLFEHDGRFEAEQSFSVLPQTVNIRHWHQLHRGMKGPYSHSVSPRSAKETTQINGVREYLYGDRLSRIHWNATAKTGEWKSKEFEREAMPRLLLILDRETKGYPKPEQFELAVSVTASLAEFGLRRETAMGLVSIGKTPDVFATRSAPQQRNVIMNHLVGVESDGSLPIYGVIQQASPLLAPGSIAVIISPRLGEETVKTMQWLDRKGLMPCLVHIASTIREEDYGTWQRLIRSRAWPIYSIRHLQELPAALEGGSLNGTVEPVV